jgi:hypothetical protein
MLMPLVRQVGDVNRSTLDQWASSKVRTGIISERDLLDWRAQLCSTTYLSIATLLKKIEDVDAQLCPVSAGMISLLESLHVSQWPEMYMLTILLSELSAGGPSSVTIFVRTSLSPHS